MWDPEQYLRHSDERSRPFHELVARIQTERPGHVVDLGCGPGQLTATLHRRWPEAMVEGIDSSATMVDAAAPHTRPGLRFRVGDLTHWAAGAGPESTDVVVANAAFQWVPSHVELFPELVGTLRPGGSLAFQVPGNFAAPSHETLRRLRESPRWSALVGAGADRHLHVDEPVAYADHLSRLGCEVDAWETTYVHILQGPDPVLEWVKGTGLRPVLAALADEPAEADAFLAEYAAVLRDAYPAQPYGTPFPFRRIFVVARRP